MILRHIDAIYLSTATMTTTATILIGIAVVVDNMVVITTYR